MPIETSVLILSYSVGPSSQATSQAADLVQMLSVDSGYLCRCITIIHDDFINSSLI